jgi:hypothetical protein
MNSSIRYVTHNDLDKSKWDSCIESSSNGIVFAYSWYLDAVCDNWDALVLNEYEAVFPITKKSKFGLNYFFNPIFALQLGLFSKSIVNKAIIEQFINAIPKKLKLIDVQLNFGNYIDNQLFEISTKKCQFIDLSSSYEEISKQYSTNLKRNLSKARKQNCEIVLSVETDNVIKLFKENRGETLKEMKDEQYQRLQILLTELKRRKLGKIYECWLGNELVASACFSITNNRIVYIKGGSTEKGREVGAMHMIMDEVIHLNSSSKMIFDFGGSSIEQVARFNHSFGAKDYEYQRLYRNNLPFIIKLLKK